MKTKQFSIYLFLQLTHCLCFSYFLKADNDAKTQADTLERNKQKTESTRNSNASSNSGSSLEFHRQLRFTGNLTSLLEEDGAGTQWPAKDTNLVQVRPNSLASSQISLGQGIKESKFTGKHIHSTTTVQPKLVAASPTQEQSIIEHRNTPAPEIDTLLTSMKQVEPVKSRLDTSNALQMTPLPSTERAPENQPSTPTPLRTGAQRALETQRKSTTIGKVSTDYTDTTVGIRGSSLHSPVADTRNKEKESEKQESRKDTLADLVSPSVVYNDLQKMGATGKDLEALVESTVRMSDSDSGDEMGAGEQPDRKKVTHESNLRSSLLQAGNVAKAVSHESNSGPISIQFGTGYLSPASRQNAPGRSSSSPKFTPKSTKLVFKHIATNNYTSESIASQGMLIIFEQNCTRR